MYVSCAGAAWDLNIADCIIQRAVTGRTNTDYLYVLDLTGDAVKISRAEIPRAEYGPSVSPSGEYVAMKYRISDSEWEIVRYRFFRLLLLEKKWLEVTSSGGCA